jgi:hypothetical protein
MGKEFSMSEENKALVRRWFEEVFNAQNFDVADEITAQDTVNHDPTLTDLPSGPEGDRYVVNLYHGAFPDANITIWTSYDALGMMQQIGAIPEPGEQAGS